MDAEAALWASASSPLVLEQARGIIMAEQQCTPDDALSILRKMATESRRTIADVAKVLVVRAGWPTDT
ncbi:MAG TPA: ANTAR domain-containing protein [Actinoplanes sp.]|jgi:AmiR/NasT family two-component response regulator